MPIVGNGPVLALADSCPQLRELDVIDGSQIADQPLILLIKACPNLSVLHTGSATHLTDTSIQLLARSHSLTLRELTLPFNNANLTLKSLESLCNHCPKLEYLGNVPGTIPFPKLAEFLALLKELRTVSVCFAHVRGPGYYHGGLTREEMETLKMGRRL
ncbi:hypothetical protein HDV05_003294, partial [Chytridiales sp. JEL 0842]